MTLPIRSNAETITAPFFNDIKTEIDNLSADVETISETTSDDFAIGDGTDTTKSITANNGDAAPPKLRYNHVDNAWEFSNDGVNYTAIGAGGGGAGDLNTIETFVADSTSYELWGTAGLTNATFGAESTSPLDGDISYKLTNITGAAAESLVSPGITLPDRAKGKICAFQFPYSYDGDDDDIEIQFRELDTSALIGDAISLKATTNGTASIQTYIPAAQNFIALQFTINTANNGKILLFDNVLCTDSPFVSKNLLDTQSYRIEQAGNAVTNGNAEIEYNLGTATIVNNGAALLVASDDSGNTRTKFTAQKKCTVSITHTTTNSSTGFRPYILLNGTSYQDGASIYSAGVYGVATTELTIEKDDFLTVGLAGGDSILSAAATVVTTFSAIAESEHVVHASAGTENHFNARINTAISGTVTNSNADFISSIVRTGANVTVTWTPGFFTVTPNIQINFVDQNTVFARISSLTTTSIVFDQKLTTTGSDVAATQNWDIKCDRTGTDYKNPNAYAVTPLTRTAYLKDVKSSGTQGGTFTSGAYRTRTLNTVEGDSEIVSLSTNQFTLPAGKYCLEAEAPAFIVNNHKIKIRNITDASDELVGDNSFSSASAMGRAKVIGIIELSSSKTFEVQHRCNTTGNTTGFGLAATFGEVEVYAQVKITKLL